MKISKGTLVRTVMTALVVLNLVLKKFGLSPLNIEEDSIMSFIEVTAEVLSIVAAWWYNNSFSKNARKAQDFLEELRKNDKDCA